MPLLFGSPAVMGFLRSTLLIWTRGPLRRWLLRRLTPAATREVLPPASGPDVLELPTRPPTGAAGSGPIAEVESPAPSTTRPEVPTVETPGLDVYPAAAPFVAIAAREAAARGVPLPIVLGVIATESNFNPRAYRAEPAIGDASRGLMQLLYRTARSLGFRGTTDELYDPAANIALGTQYLADGLEVHRGDIWAAVSRYNNGSGKRATKVTTVCEWRRADGSCGSSFTAQPGQFFNQRYVDKVERAARVFGYDDSAPIARAGIAGGPVAVILLLGLLGALVRRHHT